MIATLPACEDQTRAAIDRLDAARIIYDDAIENVQATPYDREALAFQEMARARVVFALRMLVLAQRRLRLTCTTCLQISEHDLDIRGCSAHYELLVAE